jgi:hypothetical protein
LNSRQLMKIAASNTRGGRKTENIKSFDRRHLMKSDSLLGGQNYMSPHSFRYRPAPVIPLDSRVQIILRSPVSAATNRHRSN